MSQPLHKAPFVPHLSQKRLIPAVSLPPRPRAKSERGLDAAPSTPGGSSRSLGGSQSLTPKVSAYSTAEELAESLYKSELANWETPRTGGEVPRARASRWRGSLHMGLGEELDEDASAAGGFRGTVVNSVTAVISAVPLEAPVVPSMAPAVLPVAAAEQSPEQPAPLVEPLDGPGAAAVPMRSSGQGLDIDQLRAEPAHTALPPLSREPRVQQVGGGTRLVSAGPSSDPAKASSAEGTVLFSVSVDLSDSGSGGSTVRGSSTSANAAQGAPSGVSAPPPPSDPRSLERESALGRESDQPHAAPASTASAASAAPPPPATQSAPALTLASLLSLVTSESPSTLSSKSALVSAMRDRQNEMHPASQEAFGSLFAALSTLPEEVFSAAPAAAPEEGAAAAAAGDGGGVGGGSGAQCSTAEELFEALRVANPNLAQARFQHASLDALKDQEGSQAAAARQASGEAGGEQQQQQQQQQGGSQRLSPSFSSSKVLPSLPESSWQDGGSQQVNPLFAGVSGAGVAAQPTALQAPSAPTLPRRSVKAVSAACCVGWFSKRPAASSPSILKEGENF